METEPGAVHGVARVGGSCVHCHAGELVWLRGGEPGEYDDILPLLSDVEKARLNDEELQRLLR